MIFHRRQNYSWMRPIFVGWAPQAWHNKQTTLFGIGQTRKNLPLIQLGLKSDPPGPETFGTLVSLFALQNNKQATFGTFRPQINTFPM